MDNFINLLRIFACIFAAILLLKRYLWFVRARAWYFSQVIAYCKASKQDTDTFIDCCAFRPILLIFAYFWIKDLKYFHYYPELYQEVLDYNNKQANILLARISQALTQIFSEEAPKDNNPDNDEQKPQ